MARAAAGRTGGGQRGWRRPVVAMAGGVALLAVATACQPAFFAGSTLTATPHGSLVDLSWTAAVDNDGGESVDHYAIEVDGVAVATTATADPSCVLTGLAPDQTFTIGVTAYNNLGQWSGTLIGPNANKARVTTTYTTPAIGNAGTTPTCVPPTDTDGDGLPDAVETNDGVYASAAATGTDPAVADTDGDSIADGEEVFGTAAGLDLPALGVKPTKKDVLIEADWYDESPGCMSHSHQPTDAVETKVVTAFADAPVPNPDGTTGINLVVDRGQGGARSGGNLVAGDGKLAFGVNNAEFDGIKSANFATNRRGYFHYVLNVHSYNSGSSSSGQAELPGNDLIVSLGCYGDNDDWVANTIVHELGHNFGLRHGGDVDTNYKPNYNSVMNYQFQFPGVDTNCDATGDGLLTYSSGQRPTLNERAVVEADGVCGPGTVGIDFNFDGTISSTPILRDLNQDSVYSAALRDFDDWGHLSFSGLANADGASPLSSLPASPEIVTEEPPPSR